GKPHGIDIRDQKMTLPLIYLLSHATPAEKKWIISTVKSHGTDQQRVKELIRMVVDAGGITYAKEKMINYRDKAVLILDEFEDTTYRKSLKQLVFFTTERNK
ncbi:MAG: polyprenyl synthetase family protein, partial [Syntrophothermus sp.]